MKVLEWWISRAGRGVQGTGLGSKLISLGAKNPVMRARTLHAKLKQRRPGLALLAKTDGGLPIPGEAARRSGMMPPTDSEMISPTVPR